MHDRFLERSRLLGTYVTKLPHPLVVDEYYVPFLLPKPGTGHKVHGEVYEVSTETLAALGALEGYPDYYDRAPVQVEPVGQSEPIPKPWVFTVPVSRCLPELLAQPMLAEYKIADHTKLYIPKERRARDHVSHYTANTSLAEWHAANQSK